MIRVNVDSIRVSLLTQHRVVVLREVDSRRYLPIWIGPFEADAIATAIQGHEPARPMTHDLLKSIVGDLGGSIRHILVSDIQDQTFYARIVIDHRGRTIEVDARPSDAIALAVRTEVPIFVEPQVLDQVGVYFDEDEQPMQEQQPRATSSSSSMAAPSSPQASEPETSDEDLSLFRNFINTLDLDKEKGERDKEEE
jgi:uncharacterized protein